MANSTAAERPKKPRPDFPLFPHRNGRWAKKVRGKAHYFGKWADDPKGERAALLWAEQKDDLLAGRTSRVNRDGLTVADLVNRFLTSKEHQRDAGDIRPRSFNEYLRTCKSLTAAFGRNRLVDDLAADDFEALRTRWAKQYGPHRLAGEVQRTRSLFKFGFDLGMIEKPMRFGPTFRKPAKRIMRAHRQKNGLRMFEAAELRAIIDVADQPLRAMILLGVNAAFGNFDCGMLPFAALDLEAGWVDYPRHKTAVERRCPLWPETIESIKEATVRRPTPKDAAHNSLVFITKYGHPWANDTQYSPVSAEFRKLLDRLKLHRPGLGFYALRHTFETIAGGSRDQVAVSHVMGHIDNSMSGVYRERIDDERLIAVTQHVHGWLWPRPFVGEIK